MAQKLHILHLEDNGNDAELVREHLADGGIGCVKNAYEDLGNMKRAKDKG